MIDADDNAVLNSHLKKLFADGEVSLARSIIELRDEARVGHETRRSVLAEFVKRIPAEVRLYSEDRDDLVKWLNTELRHEDDRLGELAGDVGV